MLFSVPLYGQIDSLRAVLPKSTNEDRANTLNQLAFRMSIPQTDSSSIYAREALSISRRLNYEKGIAQAHHNIGFAFHIKGHLDSALTNYSIALEIQESMGNMRVVSALQNNMGAIFNLKGNFPKALEYYQGSLKIKRSLQQNAAAATTLNNIGIIHYQQKQYDQASTYYQEALNLDTKIKNYAGMTRTLGNIGLVEIDLKNYDGALKFYSQAYNLSDSTSLPCQKTYYANGLGTAYFELGEDELALEYALKALKVAQECEDQVIVSSSLVTLGQIDIRQNRWSKGEDKLLRSYQVAKKNELKVELNEVTEELYTFYKSQRNIKKALQYHEELMTLRDSLFNEDLTQRLTSMEMTYTFEQEKDSIQFAQDNITLAYDAELDKRKSIQWMTVLILALAILFLVIVYRFYIQKRKANEGLVSKNKVISDALEEREVLLQEVHHRVKNNLQVVSSLLNIQSRYLKDEGAKRAILEGRDRVISMSMVHQRLYKNDNLSKIKIHEYLDQLSESIFETYKIEQDDIHLKTTLEPLDLDLETSINLGLITNELISNALKHAFTGKEKGEVHLTLCKSDKHYKLSVADDGLGVDHEDDLKKSHGFKIIESLVRGLSASLEVQLQPSTCITVKFIP